MVADEKDGRTMADSGRTDCARQRQSPYSAQLFWRWVEEGVLSFGLFE